MHVAFGRVRRKSRIVADYTDYADFCLLSVFGEEGGGLCITVWGRKLESLRYKSVGNRSSLLQRDVSYQLASYFYKGLSLEFYFT